MPPHVWVAYLRNVERHLAEVTIMQAQAATYGALAEHKSAGSSRSGWMSRMQRQAFPPEEDKPAMPKAVFKARMQAAGFAVKEVPKKESDGTR